jgi:type III secretion protein D
MNRHEPPIEDAIVTGDESASGPWTLAVFSGLHAGARTHLEPHTWSLVGAAPDCDLVLRDDGLQPHHLLVAAEFDRISLRALDGGLRVGDSLLEPGVTLDVIGASRIELGGVLLGVGQAGSAAWIELEAQCIAAAPEVVTVPALEAPADDKAGDAPEPRARFWRWQPTRGQALRAVALTAAGSTIVAIGIATAGALSQRVEQQHSLAAIEQTLKAMTLAEVKVTRDVNGHLLLEGVVPSEGSRLQLARELGARGQHPAMHLVSGEELARSVQDGFRQRGLQVGVVYAGAGRVQVSGAPATAQTEQAVREVLAGTAAVRHVELVAPAAPAAQALAAASTAAPAEAPAAKPTAVSERDPKRVVGVVGGDNSFVLTKDGTRYMPGAVMPDGSQIEQIQGYSVTFLREGQRVQVDF